MKKNIVLLAFLLLIPALSFAQEDTSFVDDGQYPGADSVAEMPTLAGSLPGTEDSPRLELGGLIRTDDRVRIDDGKFTYQEYLFGFHFNYRFADKARFVTDVDIRGIQAPGITRSSDLTFANKVMPIDVRINTAFLDIYGVFTRNLDMRIGRQRIAWGTGDRFNPTDNLNPYNLEDVWNFGQHLPSNAIVFDYYAKQWTFTAVGILNFTPSVLPGSDWTPAFMPEVNIPEVIYDSSTIPTLTIPVYLSQGNLSDSVILPERNIKHSPTFGIKVKRSIGAWDLSLSYVYTRDALPTLSRMHTKLTVDSVIISLPDLYAKATADVQVYLDYPVQKIIGFDFAGSLWGMGLRGEAACIIPEKKWAQQSLHYEAPALSIVRDSLLPDSLVSDGKAYVKFLLGMDYTFPHDIYLNFQYLHGFLHERSSSELNDYFILGADWSLLKSKLKLSLLNCGLQVSDWKDLKSNYAFLYMPEIFYGPFENAEFRIGAHIIDGSKGAGFGRVHKNDGIFTFGSLTFFNKI